MTPPLQVEERHRQRVVELDAIRITTPCPTCRAQSLFIGSGGYLTCAILKCPNPGVDTAIRDLTHTTGRIVLALLQNDLAGAQRAAEDCYVEISDRGPYVSRWWPER